MLWKAAGLRRDAIASYVCAVCSFIISIKLQFTQQMRLTCVAMAFRRSHAASNSRNYFISLHPPIANAQSAPCPEGTRIHQKPTASSEGAQLWDKQSSPPYLGSAKRDPQLILNLLVVRVHHANIVQNGKNLLQNKN